MSLMLLGRYFWFVCPLPTPEETGIGVSATREANKAVQCVLDEQANEAGKKKQSFYGVYR